MRTLVIAAALIVVATGVTPFDLSGIEIGADRVGELTLTVVLLICLFFVLA